MTADTSISMISHTNPTPPMTLPNAKMDPFEAGEGACFDPPLAKMDGSGWESGWEGSLPCGEGV